MQGDWKVGTIMNEIEDGNLNNWSNTSKHFDAYAHITRLLISARFERSNVTCLLNIHWHLPVKISL